MSAAVGPQLRHDLAIVEQSFRGETSFVVKDPTTRKYFRFGSVEIGVMRCFDGHRTPEEIALSLAEQGLRLSARTVEAFARKLASIGLLERTLAERTTMELERLRAERRRRRRPALFRGELLRMRWSMGDPDVAFTRVLPALRWCFTPAFIVVSALLFTAYFAILAARWSEFSSSVVRLYSLSHITAGSVVVLWLTALVVIFIHEIGHGITCKYFGGEVHEMGFMLVYFQPAFYCNVTDAWSFPELSARLWVTAAGGWIQFVVASIAAIVWSVVQPDTLASEVAIAAMIIGGATTIVTNLNPLIPLDGYFALTDWLEIPNLRQRALAYFGWHLRRNVLQLELAEPAVTEREKRTFLIYGALAVCNIAVIFGIVGSWVIGWGAAAFGAIGVLLALALIGFVARHGVAEWGRAVMLAVRSRRGKRMHTWRQRALTGAIGVTIPVLVMAFMPWTLTTSGPFVLAPAMTSELVAPDSGVVAAVYVREGTRVPAGAPLVRMVNRAIEGEMLSAARAVDSLSSSASRARGLDQAERAARFDDELAAARSRLVGLQSRIDALTLRARTSGVVTTAHVEALEGMRVYAGARILTLAVLDSLEARIALDRLGATRVRAGQAAHLVMLADPGHPIDAPIANVSAAGHGASGAGPGAIEARLPVRIEGPWRAAAMGEAKVELRKSTLLVALWWSIRQRIRGDLLL